MELVAVTSSPEAICPICGGSPSKPHFGTRSCAACAAFFRRTVAMKRSYFCKNGKRCNLKNVDPCKLLCRYCRFMECLRHGMKVSGVEATVDSVYDDKTPLADAMRTYKWSFLVRNAKTVDLYGGPQFYEPMANKLRTGRSVQIALKAECHVLLQLLHALRLTDNPASSLTEAVQKILLSWTGFEIARNTSRNLGFLSNTLYFIDESTMPVTQPGIARYYASLGCRDPDITARFAMTFFTEILRISRIFYDMRFDETEIVALFELYLLKLVRSLPEFDPTRLAQLTNHVCFGLKEHCSNSYSDFPARMGSVVTALGEIDSLHNLSQQVNILLQLHGVEQVPQRLD